MASTPANIELKCKVSMNKCSYSEVLKKHMKRGHTSATAHNATTAPNNTVWKITQNLNTNDVKNLLQDEKEIREEVEKLEHDIGLASMPVQQNGMV